MILSNHHIDIIKQYVVITLTRVIPMMTLITRVITVTGWSSVIKVTIVIMASRVIEVTRLIMLILTILTILMILVTNAGSNNVSDWSCVCLSCKSECQASEMADIYPSFDIVYLLPYFLETSAPGVPCTTPGLWILLWPARAFRSLCFVSIFGYCRIHSCLMSGLDQPSPIWCCLVVVYSRALELGIYSPGLYTNKKQLACRTKFSGSGQSTRLDSGFFL